MENERVVQDEISTYVVCRVKNNLFSINGRYVFGIQQIPEELVNIPNSPDYVRGSFKNQERVITVVDLRRVFGWTTSAEEYAQFTQMIDSREQDHTKWVEVLEKCRNTDQPFTLARDAHDCNLGHWRDQYQSHVQTVNHLLQELDPPHEALHHLADTILKHDAAGDQALQQAKTDLVPRVLSVLENMKVEFKDSEFREMIIVIQNSSGTQVAAVVDEVLGVESLEPVNSTGTLLSYQKNSYVRRIQQRLNDQELVMELDIPLLTAELELKQPK